VNATPLGARQPLPAGYPALDWSATRILDLAYGDTGSGFAALARAAGAPYRSGLTFLAIQARGQFRRWTGIEPDPSWFPAEDPS
jgi:shikimate 5-dehydrogenase